MRSLRLTRRAQPRPGKASRWPEGAERGLVFVLEIVRIPRGASPRSAGRRASWLGGPRGACYRARRAGATAWPMPVVISVHVLAFHFYRALPRLQHAGNLVRSPRNAMTDFLGQIVISVPMVTENLTGLYVSVGADLSGLVRWRARRESRSTNRRCDETGDFGSTSSTPSSSVRARSLRSAVVTPRPFTCSSATTAPGRSCCWPGRARAPEIRCSG